MTLVLCLAVTIAQAMTLDEAIKKVRRDTGGKILSAQTRVEGNRRVHVIRVLTPNGRVREIRLPGNGRT